MHVTALCHNYARPGRAVIDRCHAAVPALSPYSYICYTYIRVISRGRTGSLHIVISVTPIFDRYHAAVPALSI
jgi:hypothetical protein